MKLDQKVIKTEIYRNTISNKWCNLHRDHSQCMEAEVIRSYRPQGLRCEVIMNIGSSSMEGMEVIRADIGKEIQEEKGKGGLRTISMGIRTRYQCLPLYMRISWKWSRNIG